MIVDTKYSSWGGYLPSSRVSALGNTLAVCWFQIGLATPACLITSKAEPVIIQDIGPPHHGLL
jgi:hypothetical protein